MTDFDDYPGRNEPTRWEVFKHCIKNPKIGWYYVKSFLEYNIFWRRIK